MSFLDEIDGPITEASIGAWLEGKIPGHTYRPTGTPLGVLYGAMQESADDVAREEWLSSLPAPRQARERLAYSQTAEQRAADREKRIAEWAIWWQAEQLRNPPRVDNDRNFSADTKRIVREVYGNKCARAGCNIRWGLHFDHIVPYSRGGKSDLSNCQLLCAMHNLSKGNRYSY